MLGMPPAAPDDLLSVGQAATLVGVSTDTLRRYARDGRLPELRTPTNQRRFRRSDVEALLAPASGAQTEAEAS